MDAMNIGLLKAVPIFRSQKYLSHRNIKLLINARLSTRQLVPSWQYRQHQVPSWQYHQHQADLENTYAEASLSELNKS